MSRSILLGLLLILLIVCPVERVSADTIRPAYLGIESSKPGHFEVTWKNPISNGAPLAITPVFPDSFRHISPIKTARTNDAIIVKYELSSESKSLEGEELKIKGLSSTTSDVLLRVKFPSGRIFRTVLRTNQPSIEIPLLETQNTPRERPIFEVLKKIDSLRLALLLVLAFILASLPRARRKGIFVCSLALIAGSFSGYFLGQLPLKESFAATSSPSEERAKFILLGLLLNVYRSFLLDQEESAYDQMSKSLNGDLLSSVYLQNRDFMKTEEEDRSQGYVERLDIRSIESITSSSRDAFSVIANWDVYGAVSHWGHIHYRCNAYKAKVNLQASGRYWKISSLVVLDEKRVM